VQHRKTFHNEAIDQPSGSTMQNTVLILGARGRFGLATARGFADAGWRVLAQTRPGAQVPETSSIEWLGIELNDTQALVRAAQGATVVVHALNPAYTNRAWQSQVLPMTDATIGITRALSATLMVPGNVYNFGATMPAVLREDTPQMARTVKGQVRIAMEAKLQTSGVRCIVIRAGDYFGSGQGTWFDTAMVKNIHKGVFTYPGTPDVSRAWAYLPDLARAFVAVAQQRDTLTPYEVFHFAGHRITGKRWLDVLTQAARARGWVKPDSHLKMDNLPWAVIRMGALFVPTWAALLEMRYLWEMPHALGNEKLTALIGSEPHTPLLLAVEAALVDLGLIATAPLRALARGQESTIVVQ
jgi:nucleoside-diphosphate-sugar epimerase